MIHGIIQVVCHLLDAQSFFTMAHRAQVLLRHVFHFLDSNADLRRKMMVINFLLSACKNGWSSTF